MNGDLPRHVGIIMDGNRRWAKERDLPVIKGHVAGQEALRHIVDHAFRKGVSYLTVYAFSTENWQRSQSEVGFLMQQIILALKKHVSEFIDSGVRIVFLGTQDGLPPRVKRAIADAEASTQHGTKGTLGICINYGGHQELVDAAKQLIRAGLPPEAVTADSLAQHLYHPEIPPVDLVIRTSGEQRLSNFMLWRAAYSEFIFRDEYWPDFTPAVFDECLVEYNRRQRRFGG